MRYVPRLPLARWLTALTAALGLALASPALADTPRGPLVLGAASLAEALNAVADAWAARHHPRPVIALAASSALARQIEAGAPADIFIAADEQWMDDVAAHHLLRAGTRADLLTNWLVLVAPAGSAVHLRIAPGFPLAAALDAAKPGARLAMGEVGSVPAGIYGKAALVRLGVWGSVADRIAGAANVRAALALVVRGEAPLGIVYATDAAAEPGVRVVAAFPETSHPPILYPVAVLATATNPDALAFRRFLASGEARAIFRARGFGTK